MANAPVTGEYPKEHQTPALTQPFAKEVVGFPLTAANLLDAKHPINIKNISGKSRGASVMLSDNTVWVALGHLASDGWQKLGEGGGSGGGSVNSVNGVLPDAAGNVELIIPEGTVKSVNGVNPTANGNVVVKVGVKTVNGAEPNAAGDITIATPEVHNLSIKYGGDVATYALTEADRDKLILFSHAGEITVTLSKAIVNSDSPLKIFYVQNTLGPIRVAVETGETLYSYSNYVEAKSIAGCIRLANAWSVAGTNTAPEDQ